MQNLLNNIPKFVVKDQWAEKYIKDNIWYPFGSILNAWATIKKEDPNYTLSNFLSDIDLLFQKALSVTITSYKIYEKIEIENSGANNLDIPLEN